MADAEKIMADSEAITSSDPPRENMIETAIKFLQNPKVRESSFPQRRAFLERKGLTKEEIDIAIDRSGTSADQYAPQQPAAGVATQPGAHVGGPGALVPVVHPAPVSTLSKLKDYLASAIVAGGLSYAVYQFYKLYLAPMLHGPSKEQKQLSEVLSSVMELRQNIAETLKSIQDMQLTLKSQQSLVEDVAKSSSQARGPAEHQRMQEVQYVNEIKDEIKSLKGLLLNRKQFPPTPVTQPIIPAWQLSSSSVKAADVTTEVRGAGDAAKQQVSGSDTMATTQNGDDVTLGSEAEPTSSDKSEARDHIAVDSKDQKDVGVPDIVEENMVAKQLESEVTPLKTVTSEGDSTSDLTT